MERRSVLHSSGQGQMQGQAMEREAAAGTQAGMPMPGNVVSGRVLSIHQGLTRTGIRLSIGERATLRARWPTVKGSDDQVRVGQMVAAEIDAGAVLLGVPGVWPGHDRWNRWEGRIASAVSGPSHVPTLAVKILGDNWTLNSSNPILGADTAPRVGDTVAVVVDPAAVRVEVRETVDRAKSSRWMTVGNNGGAADPRVWMRGRLSGDAAPIPSGWLLPLTIGQVRVGAVIDASVGAAGSLRAGNEIEIHIGPQGAWLKAHPLGAGPVPCSLVYSDR